MPALTKLEAEIICDRLGLPDCICDALQESWFDDEAIVDACDKAHAIISGREFPENPTPEIIAVIADAIEGSTMACDARCVDDLEIAKMVKAGRSAARKVSEWVYQHTGDRVVLVFPER